MYNLIGNKELQPEIKKHLDYLNEWMEKTDGLKIPLKKTLKARKFDYKHLNEY